MKISATKTSVVLGLTLVLVILFPLGRVNASGANDLGSAASGDQSAFFLSTTVVSVTVANPSVSVGFLLDGLTMIDFGVNDQYQIGDEYTVTLDGDPLFQTSAVPQPSSATVCTEAPPGDLASCAAEQAAGQIVQSGYGGCDLATAFGAGLSWGDSTIAVGGGHHELVITDVSPSFASGAIESPASLCVIMENPPSFTTPEFPLGTTLLLAVTMVGVMMARSRVNLRGSPEQSTI
jgi:hypothetical protein